jgi:hypothetical protein
MKNEKKKIQLPVPEGKEEWVHKSKCMEGHYGDWSNTQNRRGKSSQAFINSFISGDSFNAHKRKVLRTADEFLPLSSSTIDTPPN